MRLLVCGLSAVLLSGCSWLGGFGQPKNSYNQKYLGSTYGHQANLNVRPGANMPNNPCVIYSPVQPVPPGCDPAQVTLATGGGGYGSQMAPAYATGAYGSHAANAGQQGYQPAPVLKKPRLRGAFSMGFEKSQSGNIISPDTLTTLDPVLGYSPAAFNESFVVGTPNSGNVTTTSYFANVQDTNVATISNSDVYSTPFNIKGGFEYIISPRTTLFANAGYAYSEGEEGSAVSLFGPVSRTISSQDYIPEPPPPPVPTDVPTTLGVDPITGLPIIGTTTILVPQPASGDFIPSGGPVVSTESIQNQNLANFSYDFSDMRRIDLEVGGRHYFNPVVKDDGYKTLTPFVGASAGLSHYNQQSYQVFQEQIDYSEAFEGGGGTGFMEPVIPGSPGATAALEQTEVLFDSQWVPTGSLVAGMEWQITPKTALALETGVRYEKARDYANGQKGDDNIAIPLTLRGSFNF